MQKPDIQTFSDFIIEYVSALVGIGTYSSRVNRCASRIAQTFGYQLKLHFSFHHTTINIVDSNNSANFRTYIVSNKYKPINFTLISDLSALSWAIYDRIHDLNVAKRCFYKLNTKHTHAFYTYIVFQSIANAAFSRLFGGDYGAMLLVLLATIVGASLRATFTYFRLDTRITYIVCAFCSSYIAFLGTTFELTKTPEVAIGSSILYLIPGIFFINSVIDILKDYVQMGLSRIISVGILISCIAIGVYFTLILSNFRLLQ